MLLYLMCFGRFPFEATAQQGLQRVIVSGHYTMPPGQHSTGTRNLVASMLQTAPAKRPDIDGVLAAVRKVLYPHGQKPESAGAAASNGSEARNGSASGSTEAPLHQRSTSAQGGVQAPPAQARPEAKAAPKAEKKSVPAPPAAKASAATQAAASKQGGAASDAQSATTQTAAGAAAKGKAAQKLSRPSSAAGASGLQAVAAAQRSERHRTTHSQAGSVIDEAISGPGETAAPAPAPAPPVDPFASHGTSGSGASAEDPAAAGANSTAAAMARSRPFAGEQDAQRAGPASMFDPFAPVPQLPQSPAPFHAGPTLNAVAPTRPHSGTAPSSTAAAAQAPSPVPIAVPRTAPKPRADGDAAQPLTAEEKQGSVLQPMSTTNPFSPPQSPHATTTQAVHKQYVSQENMAAAQPAGAPQERQGVRSRLAQIRKDLKGGLGGAGASLPPLATSGQADSADCSTGAMAYQSAGAAPSSDGQQVGSPSSRRKHFAAWFGGGGGGGGGSSGGAAAAVAGTAAPVEASYGVAAYISSAMAAEEDNAQPVDNDEGSNAPPPAQLPARLRQRAHSGAGNAEPAAGVSTGAAAAAASAVQAKAVPARRADDDEAADGDLQFALASVTAERDDLKMRLAMAQSQVEHYRTRVAEMRSVIEALSNSGHATNKVSAAALASAVLPDDGVATKPAAAQYISELGSGEEASGTGDAAFPAQLTNGVVRGLRKQGQGHDRHAAPSL